jgi:hypothetical protein
MNRKRRRGEAAADSPLRVPAGGRANVVRQSTWSNDGVRAVKVLPVLLLWPGRDDSGPVSIVVLSGEERIPDHRGT